MGLSLVAYAILALTGIWMLRSKSRDGDNNAFLNWMWRIGNWDNLLKFHYFIGWCMVSLVMLLLFIGIIGTLGHFGTLGQSSHLFAGITVVVLVLVSAGSTLLIRSGYDWARRIHIGLNIVIFFAFAWVSLTGWSVVQKYLP
ncbi:FIG00872835: hypothetical protein [Richelia intracellularis]|nr:FIG00872835: hypothetical protein [Richelia intracellularis]